MYLSMPKSLNWFVLSLAYPAISIAFILLPGWLFPPSSGLGYVLILLGFLMNLPGILICKLSLGHFSPEMHADLKFLLFFLSAMLTWGFIVLPASLGIHKLIRS